MCGGRGLRSDRLRPQRLVRRRPRLTGLACAVESRVPNLASSEDDTRDGLCRVGQSGAGCTANFALERQNDTNDNLRKMEGHYRIFFVTLCSMLNVRLLEPARRLELRKPTGTSGLSLLCAQQARGGAERQTASMLDIGIDTGKLKLLHTRTAHRIGSRPSTSR